MSPAPGSQGDETGSPATSILQSTERVANVIVNTLSRNRNTFTISRPNLGMYAVHTTLNDFLSTNIVLCKNYAAEADLSKWLMILSSEIHGAYRAL